jgi:hypothetical protein
VRENPSPRQGSWARCSVHSVDLVDVSSKEIVHYASHRSTCLQSIAIIITGGDSTMACRMARTLPFLAGLSSKMNWAISGSQLLPRGDPPPEVEHGRLSLLKIALNRRPITV